MTEIFSSFVDWCTDKFGWVLFGGVAIAAAFEYLGGKKGMGDSSLKLPGVSRAYDDLVNPPKLTERRVGRPDFERLASDVSLNASGSGADVDSPAAPQRFAAAGDGSRVR